MTQSSTFRSPKFLTPSDEPNHRLRCAIHGFIRYSNSERQIIDHPLFRRLRYIKQLALTELIYPGATHSRFEHSLGVMDLATRIFDCLASKEGAMMESVFSEIPELKNDTMAKARQICRLAGLLHDIGHCCFSHAAEKVLHKDSGHEKLSVDVIKGEQYLGRIIDRLFFSKCAELTASLIKNPAPQLQLLKDIISGQIDADRTDYLLRDSYHCGVEYGRFDYRRLIECLTLWRSDEGGLQMAIHRDGIHSFESLILARHQMNTQVYYHRLRRIYDLYLENYFRELSDSDPSAFDSPEKVLELNDFRAMVKIMDLKDRTDSPGYKWAHRIVNRNHHRDIFSLDEKDGTIALKKATTTLREIRSRHPNTEFLEDFPGTVTIHKIATTSDHDEGKIDFPMIDGGRRDSLGERSQILDKLPSKFRIGYIFADVPNKTTKETLAKECRTIFRES
jgi:uncharacterized protein